jgi:hypothetical protein
MNAIPYVRFVAALAISALLYYIFNIMLKEYLIPNESLNSVTTSGPYPFFLLFWNGLLLVVMVVEAIRLFVAVQRRTGLT